MRFCSGARVLDRALVVADPPGEAPSDRRLLLDVDVTVAGVEALADTWCTTAMADADTLDVVFDDVPVTDDALVGEPGWYVDRPGFALGGAGVAAVWWGGAARCAGPGAPAICARPRMRTSWHTSASCTPSSPPRTPCSGRPPPWSTPTRRGTTGSAVATVRAAVERAAREVVDRAPRIVGPAPLSRDADLARALADLALYVRQHHAERDHAALGAQVVDRWRTA